MRNRGNSRVFSDVYMFMDCDGVGSVYTVLAPGMRITQNQYFHGECILMGNYSRW